jgi:hypothetical protein
MMLGFTLTVLAWNDITRQGTTFVQEESPSSRTSTPPVKTKYTSKASDGTEYPIYLSSKGKAFIIKVSKKTGKEYKQYLPEVTKQLTGK